MKRAASIEALLQRANADFQRLQAEYQASLTEKRVRDDLKVSIKNMFENLRSCLDYMAQDIFEIHCPHAKKPDRLYFPIRSTAAEFASATAKDFPGLQQNAKDVYDALEAVQPHANPWLGQFNKLNNHNKHQNLAEQTRTESRRVTVSGAGGGSVSWGPGVRFGPGVRVLGVPIDPATQMPVPNSQVKTDVKIWVDFRFAEIDQPVLPFLQASIQQVDALFRRLRPLV